MSHRLSGVFHRFATSECENSSPLYFTLSNSISQDEVILDIAEQTSPRQPIPNMLFASVHYLLSKGTHDSHTLKPFYQTFTPTPANPDEAYPHFRDFVLVHANEIVNLLKSRRVQTNEVRRCAYLLPAFLLASSHFGPRPLGLVEIGTSAGLNLLWDKYKYSYGDDETYGDLSSSVLVTSSFRGVTPPILTAPLPDISHRLGIDMNVVDTSKADQTEWLRALIWPEHHERRALMNTALKKCQEVELDLRFGDGFAMLSDLAKEIPEDSLLCVYHTHVANQISREARQVFLESVDDLGSKRDVIHLFNNIKPTLHLSVYHEGQKTDMPLAKTDGHARWIEWLQHDEGS